MTIGAYFVALTKLADTELITLVCQIMANEAQHDAMIGLSLPKATPGAAVPYGLVQGTTVSAMRIPRALVDDMVAHALADDPNECCGLVSSRNGDAVKVYRTTNTEASKFRFVIDPQEQLRIYNEIEGAGLDLGAIYHSHTRSEPYPSQTDINFAKDWPGVLWIIIGLANGEPEVKSYEIRDGQVAEATLAVS